MKKIFRKLTCILICAAIVFSNLNCILPVKAAGSTFEISESQILDKMKGSWVGQMIGVTWGADTEFKALGCLFEDDALPQWSSDMINSAYVQDDIYVEIPFMEAMNEHGVDCGTKILGDYFKNTTFPLWEANYQARANLQCGINAPMSGHYLYNDHCDDIDWQIEADFVGQMSPGMVNTAIETAFDTGHVTNYGDGVYGGVYVSAMHAKAYTASTLEEIIETGRLSIPENTKFRNIIDDVTNWYKENKTFEETWQLLQDKWGNDDRCPNSFGASRPLNMDAKLNAAYVLMGLLYGEGDFGESIRLSMKCGQDSDCNPSTVAAILGNFIGFSNIPEKYTNELDSSIKFTTTNYNLDEAIALNIKLAKETIEKNGGSIADTVWNIPDEGELVPAEFEQWPDQPTVTASVKQDKYFCVISINAMDNAGIREYSVDYGDGFIYTGTSKISTHEYADEGLHLIKIGAVNNNGSKREITRKAYTGNNLAADGTPIISITKPDGAGNKDINVIRDGIMPDFMFSGWELDQYDTYRNSVKNNVQEYVGYTFDDKKIFNSLVFQEGKHFYNGGWFANGFKVQIRNNNVWQDITSEITPDYPNSDDCESFGAPFEIYAVKVGNVSGDGIRIIGNAGGISRFISVSELMVFGDNVNMTSLEIAKIPDKTTYEKNEELDLKGLSVIAYYSDNTSREIKDYDVSGYDKNVTGEQTIKVTYNNFECSFKVNVEETKENPIDKMEDIPSDFWGYKAIEKCMQEGLFIGKSENQFGPEDSITRAEFAQMLYNYYKNSDIVKEIRDISFDDIKTDDYYYDAVMTLAKAGILNGTGKNYEPESKITREDAVLILMRIIIGNEGIANTNVMSKVTQLVAQGIFYDDFYEISDYALQGFVAGIGVVINGNGDRTITPKAFVSRAECAQMMYNYLFAEKK